MKIQFHSLALLSLIFVLSSCTSSDTSSDESYQVTGSSGMVILTGSYSESQSGHIAYINDFSWGAVVNSLPAEKNAAIGIGTKLETLTWGYIEIIFRDHSIFRLEENSSLEIWNGGSGETLVDLKDGTLWARVLKPFTDSTFFTLQTDDVSAWVRWTSVLLRIKDGSTELIVVDTTSGETSSGWVEWQSRDAMAYSWALGPEEKIVVKKDQTWSGKTKIDIKTLIQNEKFVRENTIKDLRYMKELSEKLKASGTWTGTQEKIISEIALTLPTKDELQSFFREGEIRDYINTLLQSGATIESFLQEVDRQEKIDILNQRTDIDETQKKILRDGLIEEIKAKITPEIQKIEVSAVKTTQKAPSPQKTVPKPTISGEARSVSGEQR